MIPNGLEEIHGAMELHDWFGYWPDFHDAEITSLHLNRTGNSFLRVHTWNTTKEVDEKGYFVQAKHIVVEFILNSVSDLCLNDFSGQNVISGLEIERTSSGFRLELGACYGLAGTIDAETISLQITPGKPSNS
jgi:hypothetical protein